MELWHLHSVQIMKLPRSIAIICMGLSLCLSGEGARADIVSNFGLGANAMAMSGAYTGLADDFSACYYNPGGLGFQKTEVMPGVRKGTAVYLGAGYLVPRLWIKDPGAGRSYADISNMAFMQIGLTIGPSALGILPERSVYFGFSLYSPTDTLIGWKMRNTSTDRYFLFFDDENNVFGFLADAAYKFNRNVSLGVGVDVLAGSHTVTNVIFAQAGFVHSESNYILIQAAPVAGLMVRLNNGARLGATYRGELKFNDYGTVNLYAGTTSLYTQPFDWIKFYIPEQYAIGASYPLTRALTGSADLTYITWSRFVDEQGDGRPDTTLFDTVVPKAGLRYAITRDLDVSGGYAFERSPVKDQTGTTNWLDGNKNLVSLGADYTFERIGFWHSPITISGYVQGTFFQPRDTWKTQTVTEYQDGYSSGGQVYDGGLQLTLRW